MHSNQMLFILCTLITLKMLAAESNLFQVQGISNIFLL